LVSYGYTRAARDALDFAALSAATSGYDVQ
jgi:hypothetical protein